MSQARALQYQGRTITEDKDASNVTHVPTSGIEGQIHDNVIYMSEHTKAATPSSTSDEDMEKAYITAYKVAYRLLGHKEASEDVAIEAVARLIEKNLHKESFANSYVARVSARLVISSWRKDATAKKYAHLIAVDSSQVGEQELVLLRSDLRKALNKLSKRQREFVVLRYIADLSEQDVASFLKCSVGTVKSTTHDALKKLRTMVEVTL